ncbi:MAG: hypothetical protein ABEJ08_04810 [Halobacteriaceae archaeon]
MSVRVLLTVVLAVVLVAAAAPAIDQGRTQTTTRAAERAATRFEQAVTSLTDSDPVPPDVPGARRVVTLRLPEESAGKSGLATFAIGGVPNGSTAMDRPSTDVLCYRSRGGQLRTVRIARDLRVLGRDTRGDSVPLRIAGGNRVTLILRYVVVDGTPTVVVARRGFKWESAANPVRAGHARTRLDHVGLRV